MKKPVHVPPLTLTALALIPIALSQKAQAPDDATVTVSRGMSQVASSEPSPEQLVDTALRLADLRDTVLPRDYIEERFKTLSGAALRQEAMHRHRPGQGQARVMNAARALLRALEKDFINDDSVSTLDLLTPDERKRYKAFAWHENDYPGGPEGPNEDMVLALDDALSRVRPERRANSTSAAVVTKAEFDDAMWTYIKGRRRPVPGQEARQLDKDALTAFLMMREAAKRDGVDIVILSSDRLPEVAQRNAARTNNPYAVASFSSHMLGLAMDVKMGNNVNEVTTRPMSNIIAMRRSPVHKWLFLKGAAYGWYPYTHEPWHWEYNPPGFRERFRKGIAPGP